MKRSQARIALVSGLVQRGTVRGMNKSKVDEAVLALLYLSHWSDKRSKIASAWKSFDWDAMARLHQRRLISNPASKAKSITFSDEGLRQAKEAFTKLFEDQPSA